MDEKQKCSDSGAIYEDWPPERRKKILHVLAKLKSGFQRSFVRMGCRSEFRKLLIWLQAKEGISEDVKNSACQLLDELQDHFACSQVGFSRAQRNAVRELLETLEISICGEVPLPISLFEAMRITTKEILPKSMLYSISGANSVTVYVDPEHDEFTSTEAIRDLLCRYLQEHGRGLERHESVEVNTANGGSPLTIFGLERCVISGTYVCPCSRRNLVASANPATQSA